MFEPVVPSDASHHINGLLPATLPAISNSSSAGGKENPSEGTTTEAQFYERTDDNDNKTVVGNEDYEENTTKQQSGIGGEGSTSKTDGGGSVKETASISTSGGDEKQTNTQDKDNAEKCVIFLPQFDNPRRGQVMGEFCVLEYKIGFRLLFKASYITPLNILGIRQ